MVAAVAVQAQKQQGLSTLEARHGSWWVSFQRLDGLGLSQPLSAVMAVVSSCIINPHVMM